LASANNPQEPAVIVGKAYDLALWVLQKVEHFPKPYRISVGDRLVSHTLDLMLLLVRSAYSSDKARLLQNADLEATSLRYLLRLAKDLRLLTIDSYGFCTGNVDEIGRMLGGWRKALARRG
jgi:23S rRNA-intervening sequence protein